MAKIPVFLIQTMSETHSVGEVVGYVAAIPAIITASLILFPFLIFSVLSGYNPSK